MSELREKAREKLKEKANEKLGNVSLLQASSGLIIHREFQVNLIRTFERGNDSG